MTDEKNQQNPPRRISEPPKPPALVQKHRSESAAQSLLNAKRVPIADQEYCRIVGQIEAAHFLERTSAGVSTVALKAFRDKKLYERAGFASFKEFCEAKLPLGYNTYMERIKTLEMLGEPLSKLADENNFGRRVLRTLRKLPPGKIASLAAKVNSGEATPDEVLDMVYDYQADKERLSALEQSHVKQGEKIGYLQDKAKKGGEVLAKRDEDIKKLKAELKVAQNPKSLTEEQKTRACADAKEHFRRGLNLIATLDLGPKDTKLRATAVGMLAHATTALTEYERLLHHDAMEGRDDA